MGLFELLKKHITIPIFGNNDEPSDGSVVDQEYELNYNENVSDEFDLNSKNQPQFLTAKLFFSEIPLLNKDTILNELIRKHSNITCQKRDNLVEFCFSNMRTESEESVMRYFLLQTDDMYMQPLPESAYRQNWHWKEAGNTAVKCRYELLITESFEDEFDYKQRANLFIDFLSAVTIALKPLIVYSKNAEKLLSPNDIIASYNSPDRDMLHLLCNIRIFKAPENTDAEMIMDTVGLFALGLPDIEVIFKQEDPAQIAELLLKQSYFIYDVGDIISSGEYVEGVEPDTKWLCERKIATLSPNRIMLDLKPY